MKAVNEETKELISKLPDKVKAQILSLLSTGPSDYQVVSEDFSRRVLSGKIRSAVRSQNNDLLQIASPAIQ